MNERDLDPWFMGKWITCCVRCLHSLQSNAESEKTTILGDEVWVCAHAKKCKERQGANKTEHRREIDRRLCWLKPLHTLVVVFDKFGNLFGYSNYFITVVPGADLDEIIRRNNRDPLVVSEVFHKYGCAQLGE